MLIIASGFDHSFYSPYMSEKLVRVFLATVSTVPLEKGIFESLIISKQADQKFKQAIIKHHGVNLMSETVAKHICSMRLSIPKDVFNAAWAVLDTKQRYTLMINHLDILHADDFEVCFKGLEKNYQELADRSRRHNVSIRKNEEHAKLAKRLWDVDYITSYEDNGSIREYSRSLRKFVDQPAILCRVKADSRRKDP